MYQTWTVTFEVEVSRAVKTLNPFARIRSRKPSGGTTTASAVSLACPVPLTAAAARAAFEPSPTEAQAGRAIIRAAIEAAANRRDFMGHGSVNARRTRACEPYQGRNPAHLKES